MFLSLLAEYFGLSWNGWRWGLWLRLPRQESGALMKRREWGRAFDNWQQSVAPDLTVRQLAEYIARRAQGVSMEPITVFGTECGPAGVFCGLASLPEIKGERIAPSFALRTVLSPRSLGEFWGRASWVTGTALPRLTEIKVADRIGFAMVVLTASLAAINFLLGDFNPDLIMAMCVSAILAAPLFCIARLWELFCCNPLPEGINTFRDLARLIANSPSETTTR